MSDKALLAREPVNGPTHLLCALIWLKLSHTFPNKGTQKEAVLKFQVQEKQLSHLITGRKYYGGSDKTGGAEKYMGIEKGLKDRLKCKKSSPGTTALKGPEAEDEGDNNGTQQMVKGHNH